MLTLAKDFYITSIESREYYRNESKLNKKYTHYFRYKNFRITLSVSFDIIGYTAEENIAIVNFGYDVDVERWSNRKQRFDYIQDLDSQNGKSTKKYFDSPEARDLILRFIERSIDKYLRTISPAIIIRGALSEISLNLPRYKRLDAPFFAYGYHKKAFDIKQSDALYKISAGEKGEEDKVIWVYCKKEAHFKQLDNVFK